MLRERLRPYMGPTLAVVLLSAAVLVLDRELHHYRLREILDAARQIPWPAMAVAGLFTCLGYLALTGYDALAFVYVGRGLPYHRIALASFVGYAFSQNLGFPLITGSAVRYRLYSGWGLGAVDVARVVAFCGVTFWLGFSFLCGLMFLILPPALPLGGYLGRYGVRGLAIALLAMPAAYMIWSARGRGVRVRELELKPPPLWLTGVQLGVSCVDWCCAAAVLYALLPSCGLAFQVFLGLFLLAQVVALVSNVPGGLGVLESGILLLLRDRAPAPALVGSLLLFRLIYYFAPLGLAAVLLGVAEVARRRKFLRRLAGHVGEWVGPLVPQVFAYVVFLAGVVLLFSGATPAVHGRLAWLRAHLPLPVVEVSHFAGSLAGAALLLVARGLQRRLDAAFSVTVALLLVGVVASVLKGFDFEEAIVLSVMLAALLPCRRHFYRRAALRRQRFTPGWLAATLSVLAGTAWLGLFSYRHVEYRDELWWQFSFSGDASRFLRAGVGVAAFVMLVGLSRLLRPALPEPIVPGDEELARAEEIVRRSRETRARFTLLGDKRLLFSGTGNACLMYGVRGRSWIALGDAIGDPSEREELAWRFHELSDLHGGWTVVHQAPPESLPRYVQMGLTPVKIGETARVRLESFSLEGHDGKPFRQIQNRFEREGCAFEVVSTERVGALLPQLRVISEAWLAEKHTREKRFTMGSFDARRLAGDPMAVVRRGDEVLGFANLWCGAEQYELSIDLMRFLPDTPHGVMDFLFSQLMLWGRRQGYQWFDLGMAPLAGLESHPLAPVWNRVGNLIFRHGEYFYNCQGLRDYKNKFRPTWEARYLVYPGGLILATVLLDLAALISGGVRGIVER